MPDEGPPTVVPEQARGVYRAVLSMGWMERARLFLSEPSPETVEDLILSGFASFTPSQAYHAVANGIDVLPITIQKAWLNSWVVRPWARRVIKRNWKTIRHLLVGSAIDPMSGPPGILGRMLRSQSWLGAIFSTPAGWAFLEWSCYNLAVYLRDYAKIPDNEPITPPPMPDPIHHETPVTSEPNP